MASLRTPALIAALLTALIVSGGCGDDVSLPSPVDRGAGDLPAGDLSPADLFPSGEAGRVDQGGPCAGCAGCCLDGKTCMKGNAESACGKGGVACDSCTGLESCSQGICQQVLPFCDETTCATCCNPQGICLGPSNETNCGLKGAPCKQCGSQERCEQGACEPIVRYAVTLVSAQVKHSDCGLGDDCDAYVEVALGSGTVVKSPTKDNTEAPSWQLKLFDAEAKDLLTQKLKVVVKDDDGALNPDDELGTCELQATQQQLTAGTLVADCGAKVKALTFSFSKL
jgi:hypothetical protein